MEQSLEENPLYQQSLVGGVVRKDRDRFLAERSHGLTSVPKGCLFQGDAADIIRNDPTLEVLSLIFSISVSHDDEGGTSYSKATPSDDLLLAAYDALQHNQSIRRIQYNHAKHSNVGIEKLMSVLVAAKKLPLQELSLRSIVTKQKRKYLKKDPDLNNPLLPQLGLFLAEIVQNFRNLEILNLASNRLGICNNAQEHLRKIAYAIAASQSLQVVDLSKNMFSYQQCIDLLEIIQHNKSITNLILINRNMKMSERNDLLARVNAFNAKNYAIRKQMYLAIMQGDIASVKILIQQGASHCYRIRGLNLIEFADEAIQLLTQENHRLNTKLSSRLRIKSKDETRQAQLSENLEKMKGLLAVKNELTLWIKAINLGQDLPVRIADKGNDNNH